MSRYIDKNKLIKRLETRSVKGDCKFCNRFEECVKINSRKGSHLNCWEMIDIPEADVVEVVHCKDCKYSRSLCNAKKQIYGDDYVGCTNLSTGYNAVCINRYGYCSYGERKEF